MIEIQFKTNKLEKTFTQHKALVRTYGGEQAKLIQRRLKALEAASALSDFLPPNIPPERCHELIGDRKGQLSMDLKYPKRLIFEPADKPRPTLPDGGLDWKKISKIRILGVEDTHGN